MSEQTVTLPQAPQEVLRQPLTVWQWLTNQPGTIYTPPTQYVPPKLSALHIIENELSRLHDRLQEIQERDFYDEDDSVDYQAVVAAMEKIHADLSKRSLEEASA